MVPMEKGITLLKLVSFMIYVLRIVEPRLALLQARFGPEYGWNMSSWRLLILHPTDSDRVNQTYLRKLRPILA